LRDVIQVLQKIAAATTSTAQTNQVMATETEAQSMRTIGMAR
jgi:hypothetical protein